jgi:hypothetical protein
MTRRYIRLQNVGFKAFGVPFDGFLTQGFPDASTLGLLTSFDIDSEVKAVHA